MRCAIVRRCFARRPVEAISLRISRRRHAQGGDRPAGPRGGRDRRRARPDAGSRLPAGGAKHARRSAPGSWLDTVDIGDAGVRLGALVRWRDIEDDARLAVAQPLLREAIGHVAHYQIRNRGTVSGSLAHADPAAVLPGIAVACDAEITLVGAAGARMKLWPICRSAARLMELGTHQALMRSISGRFLCRVPPSDLKMLEL
jgi:hypothetical protein